MLRLALTPRWLGLLLVALLIASGFAWLGSWQLARSRENADPVVIQKPRPLQELVQPQEGLPPEAGNTPAIVRGSLDADQTVIVDGRRRDGEPVDWLVAPVLMTTAAGTARLPVVLGAFPAGRTPPPADSVEVDFTAMLQPSEEPAAPQQDGDTGAVSSADLVARWGSPIYAGFVFADEPTMRAAADDGLQVIEPPTIEQDRGYAILNLSYAVQWWIFAAIAFFLWWRLLRDNYADRSRGPDPDEPADHPAPDNPAPDNPAHPEESLTP